MLSEAGGEVGGVVETDLFPDTRNWQIGLQQQQLGSFDAEAHQIIEWCTAEFLLHASGNVDGVEVNALPKLLCGNRIAVMLAQIGRGLLRAQGGGSRALCFHRSRQVLDDLLERKLLLPFDAGDMIIHIKLHQLAQKALHLGGLEQLRELGELLCEGLCRIKA